MKKKKEMTIRKSFILAYLIPALISVVLLVGMTIFLVLYNKLDNRIFLYVGIAYTLTLVAIYIVVALIAFRKTYKTYYHGLYRTTAVILRNLKNNVVGDDMYPETNIEEINELNKDLEEVNTIVSNSTMISADLENSYIPLVFISEENRLVTLDSFKNELRSLIYCSQNYRNAIIELFYDLNDDTLTKEEGTSLLKYVQQEFKEYKHYIFAPNENGSGFFMFLPRVESFSHIKERLLAVMKQSSVTKKTFDGLTTIPLRFSIVCYPYSNIDELFPDLLYAKRQGLPLYLYLPNRLNVLSESRILQNSLNMNNMSRILEKLNSLKVTLRERENSRNTIRETLLSLSAYLNIDYCGVIVYDDVNSSFNARIVVSQIKEALFKEGDSIDKGFINALDAVKDDDDSLYFSSRNHVGYELARYLDRINISGGFYYLVHDQGKVIAAIYFFNKNREFVIDSYIRESLFILSYRIGDFISVTHEEDKVGETYREINAVLLNSDIALYRINRHTYDLVGFSSHFTSLFPKATFGEKCYKALYGLDAPCLNCPLKTSRKMISEIKGGNVETSLTINETKSLIIRMMVKFAKGEMEATDRFDRDLLINSYYSLKVRMEDLYAVNTRGYLVVMRIDNHDELLAHAGSEGYLYLLRNLIRRIKEVRLSNANIYKFSTQSIAILMPEIGQVDIVNFIEKIYDVSKEKYTFNEVDYSFNLTYLPYQYPQQFPSGEDFLKYTLRHFNALNYPINKDMITIPDGDYSRSASRNTFMLSVIEEQFGNKTFTVALQPFVRAGDKAIFGAELLIRLSDNYRNSVLNADALIKVAGQNGKISLISNALIGYIGELYQQYGMTVFKISGFQRLTINTDYSFFEDPTFFQTIFDTFAKYSFQKNFLGFEITEQEVYSHIADFKKITKGILNHHIVLICDQYSGEYLSMDLLKELGFTEVKIGRNLVKDIEVNPKHWNEIMSIDQIARDHDFKITFVGVENADQYIMLRDLDKNCMCQGYHFFRPLEDYKLIEELRKNK